MRRDISKFIDAVRSVGLADAVEPAAAIVQRAGELSGELVNYRARADRAFSAAVAEVARNGITTKALTEVRLQESARHPSSLSRVVDHARVLLWQQAEEACQLHADELFAGLCAVVHDAVGVIETLGIPKAVTDEAAAWRAGVNLAALEEHTARFFAAHEAYRYMRQFGWMPELDLAPLYGSFVTDEWAMFDRPDRAWSEVVERPTRRFSILSRKPVWYLRLWRSGAKPGMYTVDEFRQAYVDMVVEQRVESGLKPGPRTWRRLIAARDAAGARDLDFNPFTTE